MLDVAALSAATLEYLTDPLLAARHAAAGIERAHSEFDRARVWRI